jgi:hypothetical protein
MPAQETGPTEATPNIRQARFLSQKASLKTIHEAKTASERTLIAMNSGGASERDASLVTRVLKEGPSTIEHVSSLEEQALDLTNALEVIMARWRMDWMDWMDDIKKRTTEIRQSRFAIEGETRALMTNLREVRNFFMDKDHASEIQKLQEFVELCERLKVLKESGFLDNVTDTILRLNEK